MPTEMTLTTRPYRPTDLDGLVALFQRSVHELGAQAYDPDQLGAWAPDPPETERWRKRFVDLVTLIAESDGEPAGFLGYELDGHIDLLYTSPRHTRRGVARMLLARAESDLIGHGASEAYTEASRIARPFFEAHGFHVTEEQTVERDGIKLQRFAMRKNLDRAAR